MKSRTEERDDLLVALGMLVDPVRRLIDATDDPRAKIPYVRSQFDQDLNQFREQIVAFCRPGKHRFEIELDAILRNLRGFGDFLGAIQYPEHRDNIRTQRFAEQLRRAQESIRAVPCEDPGMILPAESPYSTYLRLRAICSGAGSRLELFDPYIEAETFHRYLASLDGVASITVVTSSDIMALPAGILSTSPRALRRDRIVAVSELLAQQFPARYQLRVSGEQHDRHLRVDDTILHLGGSTKDAAKSDYFTISQLDPTQSTHAFLDGIIVRAIEWFGPTVGVHRRS
jgi:hypothetical protein